MTENETRARKLVDNAACEHRHLTPTELAKYEALVKDPTEPCAEQGELLGTGEYTKEAQHGWHRE